MPAALSMNVLKLARWKVSPLTSIPARLSEKVLPIISGEAPDSITRPRLHSSKLVTDTMTLSDSMARPRSVSTPPTTPRSMIWLACSDRRPAPFTWNVQASAFTLGLRSPALRLHVWRVR